MSSVADLLEDNNRLRARLLVSEVQASSRDCKEELRMRFFGPLVREMDLLRAKIAREKVKRISVRFDLRRGKDSCLVPEFEGLVFVGEDGMNTDFSGAKSDFMDLTKNMLSPASVESMIDGEPEGLWGGVEWSVLTGGYRIFLFPRQGRFALRGEGDRIGHFQCKAFRNGFRIFPFSRAGAKANIIHQAASVVASDLQEKEKMFLSRLNHAVVDVVDPDLQQNESGRFLAFLDKDWVINRVRSVFDIRDSIVAGTEIAMLSRCILEASFPVISAKEKSKKAKKMDLFHAIEKDERLDYEMRALAHFVRLVGNRSVHGLEGRFDEISSEIAMMAFYGSILVFCYVHGSDFVVMEPVL